YRCFFFSSRRRHTRSTRDWSSDVCSSDLAIDTEQLLFDERATAFFLVLAPDLFQQRVPWVGLENVAGIFFQELLFTRRSQHFYRSEERRVGKGVDFVGSRRQI